MLIPWMFCIIFLIIRTIETICKLPIISLLLQVTQISGPALVFTRTKKVHGKTNLSDTRILLLLPSVKWQAIDRFLQLPQGSSPEHLILLWRHAVQLSHLSQSNSDGD